MLHYIIKTSIISLFVLTSAKANIPTIQDLKDPFNTSYGLHLERVDLRQQALRKKGIADDISTKIVLFRMQKTLLKKLIGKKLSLLEEIEYKTHKTSPRASTRKKIQIQIAALQGKHDTLDQKITGYRVVQKKLGNTIMNTFGLKPTQLALIPAK